MKMSQWLAGGQDGADEQAIVTTSYFNKGIQPITAVSFNSAKVDPGKAATFDTVVDIEAPDIDSDYEYYDYSDNDIQAENAAFLNNHRDSIPQSISKGSADKARKHASMPIGESSSGGRRQTVSQSDAPKDIQRRASAIPGSSAEDGGRRKSIAPDPISSSSTGEGRRKSIAPDAIPGSTTGEGRRKSIVLDGAKSSSRSDAAQKRRPDNYSSKTIDRPRGRRLNADGTTAVRIRDPFPSSKSGTDTRKKGASALRDPKVRGQLVKLKEHKPMFIFTITMVHVIVFLYEIYLNQGLESFGTNPFLGPSALTLIHAGAKYTPCMRSDPTILGDFYTTCADSHDVPRAKNGSCLYYDNLAFICGMGGFTQRDKPDQIWRFITPIFAHSGILHLAFNMLIQVRTGIPLEKSMGSLRMIMIYMISGIAGNALASDLAPNSVSAGASGSLLGLIALLYIDLYSNWPLLTRPKWDLVKVTINVMIALAVGLLPLIDNYAHIGGFIAGLLSGMIFMPKIAFSKWDRRRKRILAIVSVPLLIVSLALTFYVFYLAVPNICPWCVYLDCLPPSASWCSL